MAAKDFYHEHVKTALQKDGWTVTDDPLKLEWMGTNVYADKSLRGAVTIPNDANWSGWERTCMQTSEQSD